MRSVRFTGQFEKETAQGRYSRADFSTANLAAGAPEAANLNVAGLEPGWQVQGAFGDPHDAASVRWRPRAGAPSKEACWRRAPEGRSG